MTTLQILTGALAIFLFLLGFYLILRSRRVAAEDKSRYMRAGVGAMAIAAGDALLFRNPPAAFLFFLVGVMLVFTSGPGARRSL